MTANAATATLSLSIRDFDDAMFAGRQQRVRDAVAATGKAHPGATIACRIEEVYRNIASSLGDDRRSVELMAQAYAELDIPANIIAMRGGTDGSALSARGIPTPNMFTGAHNFHSPFEFLPVPSFVRSFEVAERIIALAAAA